MTGLEASEENLIELTCCFHGFSRSLSGKFSMKLQFIPRRKGPISIRDINLLMLLGEIVGIHWENYKQNQNSTCGKMK
jgi:hypothetical protein